MIDIVSLLGNEAEGLLGHQCAGIPQSMLHLPGPDYVERVLMDSDRRPLNVIAERQFRQLGSGDAFVTSMPACSAQGYGLTPCAPDGATRRHCATAVGALPLHVGSCRRSPSLQRPGERSGRSAHY